MSPLFLELVVAKWLEEKLKPLSLNEYTITDAFDFADEVQNLSVDEDDILISYEVTVLFTNVLLTETISISQQSIHR